MSLDVSPALLEAAARGPVADADFVDTIRHSLPYAWEVVSAVATDVGAGRTDFADHEVPPPSEQARGELLRALASDSMRGALERHFGVTLAFQNCHRVGAFAPAAVDGARYREFVSARGQLLNQSPELRSC